MIELIKLKYNLKISVFYIESSKNTSADMLSRGITPRWLSTREVRCDMQIEKIDKILLNAIRFWKKTLSL